MPNTINEEKMKNGEVESPHLRKKHFVFDDKSKVNAEITS